MVKEKQIEQIKEKKKVQKKKKPKSHKKILKVQLSEEVFAIAKKVFAAKHPYIDFTLDGYLNEKIFEDAILLGIDQKTFITSYPQVIHLIRRYDTITTGFVSTVNRILNEEQMKLKMAQGDINTAQLNAQAVMEEYSEPTGMSEELTRSASDALELIQVRDL